MVRNSEDSYDRQSDAPLWLQRPGDRLAKGLSAVGLERWARMAAGLLSVLLLVNDGRFLARSALVLGLVVYIAATGLLRRGRLVRLADLLMAAALVVLAGDDVSAFVPFLLVAVAGTSAHGDVPTGLAAGGALSLVLVATWLVRDSGGGLQQDGVLALVFLLPLTGLLTASAVQLLSDRTVRDRLALQEAHRLLTSLSELAGDLPGGLDLGTVSAAVLAEARRIPGAQAVTVLLLDGDRLTPNSTSGLRLPAGMRVHVDRLLPLLDRRRVLRAERDLPDPLDRLCADLPAWRAQALGQADVPGGVLLVGFVDLEHARRSRHRLRSMAQDGGLALDNARLFGGTQLRAADAARRRIAGQLHDGVAQSLTHLKLELELLSRDPQADPAELERLARVAESALEDLRHTIAGLRAPASSDLGALISRHLEDLRSARGPHLSLVSDGRVLLGPERADEAFRVAQEALSNALRHADATRVQVGLSATSGSVRLSITDDGVGYEPDPDGGDGEVAGARRGVGLHSMRERAARLGGEITVGSVDDGGTRVLLSFPVDPILPTGGS